MKTFYFFYLIVQLFCINFAHSENQTNWTEVNDLFFVKFDENCVKKENLDICESSKSLIDIKINIEKHKFITIYEHGKVIENIVIFDYNNRKSESSTKYKKEHTVNLENKFIEIKYSHLNKTKEERIIDLVEYCKEFSPEVIITTTIFSNAIN